MTAPAIASHWRWQDYAACSGMDRELFFPAGDQEPPPEVRAACASCPVRALCLAVALDKRYEGYWGGTTDKGRDNLRRRQRRREQVAS